MSLTDIFINRPITAAATNCFILLVGIAALFLLPLRQYPLIDATTISISVSYPGANEEQMLGFVTAPIAQAVSGVDGVDYVSSETHQGRTQVNVRLDLNADHQQVFSDVTASIDSIRYLLPDGATDPAIARMPSDPTAVTYLAVSSPNHSVPQVTDYINRVVLPRLTSVDGVGRLEVVGGQDLAVRLWLSPSSMASLGVTADDLTSALTASHVPSAGGRIESEYTSTDVQAHTQIHTLDELANIVVRSGTNGKVRVGDIGKVEFGPKSTDQNAYLRGKRAVFIAVNASPGGNPLVIMDQIRDLLPDIKSGAPSGFDIEIGFDATTFINSSLRELIKTVFEAVIVVSVVMFAFLGTLRVVLIPIVAVPISLVGAAALLYVLGFSINLLTLLAMVLAIGLVVDDAIVVVENIYRHVHLGHSTKSAALIGAREVVGPVIAMTFTLAAVYAPIGFASGLTGSLFKEFAFALAGSVIVSGIVALTLSPVMASYSISSNQSRLSCLIDRQFSRFSLTYESALDFALRHRLLSVVSAIAVALSSYWFFWVSSKELAPTEDQGYIYTAVQSPDHVNLRYTETFTTELEKLFSSLGEYHDSFMVNGPVLNEAFGGVILKPWHERARSQQEILSEIQSSSISIDGVNVFAFSGPSLPGSTGGFPLQMVLTSPRPTKDIRELADEVISDAYQKGVFAFANTDVNIAKPVSSVSIDRLRLDEIGVSVQSVANTLQLLLSENYVSRVEIAGKPYEIIPQVDSDYRSNRSDIEDFEVETNNGDFVPLSSFVSIEDRVGPNKIAQHNQLNSVTIRAILPPGISISTAVEHLTGFANNYLPGDVSFDWLGESRQLVQEGNSFYLIFSLSIIFIYLVLGIQFNSLVDPIIILVSVPLCLFGALLPMFLGLTSINIYSQIGLVTLIGLISKHGILIVQFANQLRSEDGLDKFQAIKRASSIRLRPILMTTAAVVFGLIPLVASVGAGAEARFSIGVVIVSGMVFGTLFTLFILPCFYLILSRPSARRAVDACYAN